MDAADFDELVNAAMLRNDWRAVDRYRDLMDAAERAHPRVFDLLPSALWYAELGLHVFPLAAGSKIPMPRSRGFLDATDDLDQVRAWWTAMPSANIGIATGHIVDVIDIDGPEGVTEWARASFPAEPLGVVCTPRAGGSHLYIPASGAGNTTNIRPKIDIRGLGGYVVAPPSAVDQGIYHWRRPLKL